ncbi:MAG: hypothetical protein CMH28_07125 [Micavibrio sp.]|nr:hypothetical protein [Micavibrio sp.]
MEYDKVSERGNVLFLILIAVVLFAALSYAVTRSTQSSGNINEEEASLAASQITQYATLINQSVIRLKAISGCSDTDISFHYDSNGNGTLETDGSDNYYNNTVTNNDCYVFHPDGAGLAYIPPKLEWLDGVNSAQNHYGEIYFTSRACIPYVGTGEGPCNSSGDDEELMMYIPYINQTLCQKLAEKFEVVQPGGAVPIDDTSAWYDNNYFVGTYSNGAKLSNNVGSDTSETINGSFSGCFEGGGGVPASGTYHFYNVVIAR